MKSKFITIIILLCFVMETYGNTPAGTEQIKIENEIVLKILTQKEAELKVTEAGYSLHSHTVERGESWESIANSYGVTPEVLKCLNAQEEFCLAGLELNVPVIKKNIETVESTGYLDRLTESYFTSARNNVTRGNYKDAVKTYDHIIKTNPGIEAYYERAFAQYKRGKLKLALNDLNHVKSYPGYEEIYPDSDELLQSIKKEIEYKTARRNQLWGNILGTVVRTGLEIGNAYLNAKYGNTQWNNNSYLPSYTSGTSSFSSYGGGIGTVTPSSYQFQIPDCLDFTKYDLAGQIQITYDQYGNAMYSNPKAAAALRKMNSDFANYMNGSGFFTNGGAIGYSTMLQMNSDMRIASMYADSLETPQYFTSDTYPSADNEEVTSTNISSSSSYSSSSSSSSNNYPQIKSLLGTYDNYVDLLMNMKNGYSTYDERSKQRMQTAMRNIRNQLNNQYGYNLNPSSMETW